ncbi:hypothetical protein [Rubrivivax gelatinosus]|uniref:hypothetical protein n=1 Tax=Rubrivivax gelatinosus TaxID=28068 RepID=UPI0019077F6A|nr:hypothetical protein [Rubrivivax gelatinosus]
MTQSLFLKLILILAVLPIAYSLKVAATRWLPESNPARRWLEQQGSMRLAMCAILAIWAFGGFALVVVYG